MTALDRSPVADQEAAWQLAARRLDRNDTARNAEREQAAHDAYADACEAHDLCLRPGCTTPTPGHVRCPAHR